MANLGTPSPGITTGTLFNTAVFVTGIQVLQGYTVCQHRTHDHNLLCKLVVVIKSSCPHINKPIQIHRCCSKD